jgi:hypothetical protein
MPTKHEIEIVITPEGNVRLDVRGMKGPSCLAAVEALAGRVGELSEKSLKSEYYESASPQARQRRACG